MERQKLTALIALGGLLVFLGWAVLSHSASYRFRMTVEAETPIGIRTASAVYEVSVSKSWFRLLPEEMGGGISTSGQALVLDLATGPVFVVMNAPTDQEGLGAVATKTFCPDVIERRNFVQAARYIGLHAWKELKVTLPKQIRNPYGEPTENWPLMVRFRDSNDPTSVEQVDPSTIRVRSIWLETTRDPVSSGIEKRLPWLKSSTTFFKPDPALGYSVPLSSLSTAQRLTAEDFASKFKR